MNWLVLVIGLKKAVEVEVKVLLLKGGNSLRTCDNSYQINYPPIKCTLEQERTLWSDIHFKKIDSKRSLFFFVVIKILKRGIL